MTMWRKLIKVLKVIIITIFEQRWGEFYNDLNKDEVYVTISA